MGVRRPMPAVAATWLLLVVTAACAPSMAPVPGDPTQAPSGAPIPSAAGDALDVTVSLDRDRSSSALIGPTGGRIATTAADGSTFALDIPTDALARDRQLTLIPVTSVAGYPFGGPLTAVHLEPEGLRFLEPATLRIEPAAAIRPDAVVGFGYVGNGSDFHLKAAASDGSGYVMRVSHFSGVGVGAATDVERTAQAAHVPADAENRLEQQMVVLLERERMCVISGLCEEDQDTHVTDEERDAVAALVDAAWDELKAELVRGETDCAAFERGASQLQGWERQRGHFDLPPDPRTEELTGSIAKGARNCMLEDYEACRTGHDLNQITVMYERVRVAAMVEEETSDLTALAERLGGRCATFELEQESRIVWTPGGSYSTHVVIPLVADVTDGGVVTLVGSKPFDVTDHKWPNPSVTGCRKEVVGPRGDAPFAVKESAWTWGPADADGAREVTRLVLKIDPGTIDHRMIVTCPVAGAQTVDYGTLFGVGFFSLHRDENAADPTSIYLTDVTFAGEEVLAGELFAQKSYARSARSEDVLIEGDFMLRLWHRPPPAGEPVAAR